LLLTGCARLAGAQTYVWTDARGVVHAASDPSEVPAAQREKAMRDAVGRRDRVTIAPAGEDAVPAAPAAPAPPSTSGRKRGHAAEPEAPQRSFEGDAPKDTTGGGVGLDANPQVTPPAPKQAPPDPKKFTGQGLPPPDPGFEWSCIPDTEGGPPKCEQFEKKNNKRERRADARRKAQDALGVNDPTDEFDPDVAKRVDQRAEEEYKKTTPTPTTKAPKHPRDDDDDSESSDETD
jgi:hypothetical protein